ncbi:MAG: ferrous iron transport protein B [Bacteroidetes bacterium]|nr:ferrous iron transport protein B [Bacteroidota bacterium]
MPNSPLHIALVGNPNSGKTSLFNALTGLSQQVGNFPGVTVDKMLGKLSLNKEHKALLIDLPGTYSLYPRREDEWVAYKVLMGADQEVKADLVLLVADASNLKRNLLFCSQIIDLHIPVVMALTMNDLAVKRDIYVDAAGLSKELKIPVVVVNPRKNKGLTELKKVLLETAAAGISPAIDDQHFYDARTEVGAPVEEVKKLFPAISDYAALHYLIHHESFPLSNHEQHAIESIEKEFAFNPTKTQAEEIVNRYAHIRQVLKKHVSEPNPIEQKKFTEKLDNLLLHRTWGYLILLVVLFLLFQSIFWVAQFPMDFIEWAFQQAGSWLSVQLPQAWWSDLLINGFLAGLSGILVFIPQIMILFGLITMLEDSGYMARIGFLSDKMMRKAGLNGKSVMPLISGFACAVPAIMSARAIENKKERLLTILVTPLVSCSARLPVYTILISLVIDNKYYFGFLSLQGLVMMGLYLGSGMMALLMSYLIKSFIKIKEKSFFILELPIYRPPRWKNVLVTMIGKARIFVTDAGRIIMMISLILWFLSSFGPGKEIATVNAKYEQLIKESPASESQLNKQWSTEKLQHSYAGHLGQTIEPLIAPLGYDWKIGIALITSFAAREVFVGTMATLYSVEETDNNSLREKMAAAKHPDGSKVYTLPAAFSLLIFYMLAMQCMSTLAVVKRETKSWKWPLFQLGFMTVLAYGMSWLVYQLFS